MARREALAARETPSAHERVRRQRDESPVQREQVQPVRAEKVQNSEIKLAAKRQPTEDHLPITHPDSPYKAEMAAASILTAFLVGGLYWLLYAAVQSFLATSFGYLWLILMPFVAGTMVKALCDVLEAIPFPSGAKKVLKFATHSVAATSLHYQLYDGTVFMWAIDALTGGLISAPTAAFFALALYAGGYTFRHALQALLRRIFL